MGLVSRWLISLPLELKKGKDRNKNLTRVLPGVDLLEEHEAEVVEGIEEEEVVEGIEEEGEEGVVGIEEEDVVGKEKEDVVGIEEEDAVEIEEEEGVVGLEVVLPEVDRLW
ncbi:hypothetical protein K435DRAFT_799462 [Dendrothele bispora CBS 962.96]|uniref:Uncharacterized protein n=1 Tax=Dendrothele bispora (strain CBS 962.96) TaxID=1314807 RepID=A0A4S8LW71_DENBC|nr:hypothetical protein K435DRAFT_799462 [Dendrothele bispora CBS 962.96]